MANELLTENEIDALTNGVGDESTHPDDGSLDDGHGLYDLTSGTHRALKWISDVEIVDDRVQAILSNKLLGLLHKSVTITREEILIQKYADYAKSLAIPTSINCFTLSGLIGMNAIVLDSKLVYALVNVFFGGGSREAQIESRGFSHTELRVINLILKAIVESIRESFKEIASREFNFIQPEMNPAHLSVYAPSDVLMIRTFAIEFSGVKGIVQFLMPAQIIDSLFRNKKSKLDDIGMSPRDALSRMAKDFQLDVSGEINAASLTIGEIFKLAVGDIINIDGPDKVDVKVNGVSKFKARMGEVNGKVGLEIR